MIYFALTIRLTYWRTIQAWHSLAAGWPAFTKAGRARRRRHRAELRNIRAYTRYLAADRAQILENMASNAAYDEINPPRTEYTTDPENAPYARDIAENPGGNDANANTASDSGNHIDVIHTEAITPTT